MSKSSRPPACPSWTSPWTRLEIGRRGLSLATVQEVIGAAIGGQDAGVVFEGDRYFEIVVRLPETIRHDLDALKSLPVSLPTTGAVSSSVPLGQLAAFTLGEGPNQVSRENGKRRVVVTANVRDRDIASVVNEARAQIDAQVKLPAGYWMTWGGQFENLEAARRRLSIVVPACFLIIFLLLMSALGSARDALLVFSAVPLALTGGVLALWLRGMPFSVSAAVGFIALSGIAVLNGLVMLTFIKQLMARGRERMDAIYEGALTRLRPVAMTALVASLGFVPIALATDGSGGSKANRDRRHRRPRQRDLAYDVRVAGALPLIWTQASGGSSDHSWCSTFGCALDTKKPLKKIVNFSRAYS